MPEFRSLRACAVIGVVLAAACSDNSAGPGTLTNPAATSAALNAFDSSYTAPAVVSFGALGPFIRPTGPLSRAAMVLQATQPRRPTPGVPPEVAAAQHLSALRRLAAAPASPQGPIIPDALYGSIYTWDVASTQYVQSSASGGPSNGIRFILYALNPLTGEPAVPLVEVGLVDLLDESAGATARLHILVEGVGGTPTYLDYTATLTPGSGSLTATVTGFVTNAAAGGANKTLTFNVTGVLTLTSATVDATFTLNNPAISIVLDASLTISGGSETVTVDFTFTRPGETVRLVASATTTNEVLDTLSAEIRVNGQVFATIEGNAQSVTFYDANGDVIQDAGAQHDVYEALNNLREAVEETLDFIEDLFDPFDD
jgi:hypothetical protein